MSQSDGIHVQTAQKGTGWVNTNKGVVLSRHNTKAVAIASGRAVAKRHGEQLTVHRKDGTIVSARTYAIVPLG